MMYKFNRDGSVGIVVKSYEIQLNTQKMRMLQLLTGSGLVEFSEESLAQIATRIGNSPAK